MSFFLLYFAPATDVSAEAISAICSAGVENRRIVGATLDQASTAALGKALHGWSHLKRPLAELVVVAAPKVLYHWRL